MLVIVQKACDDDDEEMGHICVADEHFVATLMAVYGQDNARDNVGSLTYNNWKDSTGWHPRTFYPGNPKAGIREMRSYGPFSG
jgi:hypothetical protein